MLKKLCLATLILVGGCSTQSINLPGASEATLMPRSATYQDLVNLPEPAGQIITSVYAFGDQTGQYRPAPASTFSTAVTQGATSMLNTALKDSGWFIPLEREGLQNLLTERKIVRAASKQPNGKGVQLPPLSSASVLLEGGIIAYETNTKTGGIGVRYLGIGPSAKYREDQVTVNLRAVDIFSGQILQTVNVTKTIFSHELKFGIHHFIEKRKLLESEAGYTNNEPAQLCVMSAIESAVIHMISAGVQNNIWKLKNKEDISNSVLQEYSQAPVPVF